MEDGEGGGKEKGLRGPEGDGGDIFPNSEKILILLLGLSFVKQQLCEWRKAGGLEPQHVSLACHILAFLSSGSHEINRTVVHATAFEFSGSYYVLNNKFSALKLLSVLL